MLKRRQIKDTDFSTTIPEKVLGTTELEFKSYNNNNKSNTIEYMWEASNQWKIK